MLIHHDPDDYVTEVKSTTCEYHKRKPWDVAWPGCTCSVSYSQRLATPKERAENIKRRQEEEARRQKHMDDYDAGKLK
jgi:hypothetical protein